MTFEKPCGSDAASSVEDDTAVVPKVGKVGVLGSDMLSQSMSTSASSSSHALQVGKNMSAMSIWNISAVHTSAELKLL
jgi:hypothetical protein